MVLWSVAHSPVVEPVAAGESATIDQASQPLQAPWNFSIVALPDTQFYSEGYPAVFDNQTQWIVDTVASLNTVFVTHEGDIVNTYSTTSQWNNANRSMSKLDGYVPWAVLPGNHDGANVGSTGENLNNYNTYFPRSRFSGQSWYGGAYNNVNSNSYELFSGGADDYLIFHFQYHPNNTILSWANATIANYPNRRVIVTTHDYMNIDDSRTTEGNHIWDNFVAAHADQVFLVLCGHMHSVSDGEAKRTDVVNGHAVHQLMADFQEGYPNGGNGWLRILDFRPMEDKIYVKTYSPYLNQFQTDADSQFTLSYDMTTTQPFAVMSESPDNATTTPDNMPDFTFTATHPTQSTFDCSLWLQNGTTSRVCATKTGVANGSLVALTPSSPVANGVYRWWINCTVDAASGVSEKRSITISVFRGDKTFTSTWDGTTRTYWLDMPDDFDISAPTPLVFFLHGYGASRYRYSDPTYAPEMRKVFQNHTWIVAAVECRESPGDNDDWYIEPSRRDITDILTQLGNTYNIDPRHVHVVGNSMGGGGALKYAMFNNQVVASLVDIHGITNFTQFYYESTFQASLIAAYGGTPSQVPAVYANESALGNEQRFSHTAVMILHGTTDSTVRVSQSRNLNKSLSALGYTVKYIEVPGVGHDAPTLINGREMEIFNWLSTHPLVEYTLTINVAGGGSVTLDPYKPMYSPSAEVSLTAIPNAGWNFVGWSGNLTGSDNPTTITMDDDLTVTATFAVEPSNTEPFVTYVHVWGYPGGLLDPGSSINSGESVRFFAGVTDAETASDALVVTISYKAEGGSWTVVSALWEPLYGGYWYYDWLIPGGATLGLYDVKVDVSDGDGGFASTTELGEFTVENADPIVNYVHVWGYPGGLLDPSGSINSGEAVRIFIGISDAETSSDLLSVTIKYKAQSDSVWTSVPAQWEPLYGGYWYYDWVIPGGVSSGLYDVKVEASDGHGGFVSVTEYGEFTVIVSNADPVVNYIHVWGYPGGLLDPAGTIKPGEAVRIFTSITDAETPSNELTVTIKYKAQADSVWTNTTAQWEPLYGGYWYHDWAIPRGVSSGLYDVMVEASDGYDGFVSVTEYGEFTVVASNANPVVNYIHVWGYPGGLLDPAGSIKPGEAVRLFTGVTDIETSSDQLIVTIKYKAQADSDWTSTVGLWEPLYGGYWYHDWVIPEDVFSGLYDVMVEVSDRDGGYASVAENGEFTVVFSASLVMADPGSAAYRWMDVANQAYRSSYQGSYGYSQASVSVSYYVAGNKLIGTVVADNLKPNFAYQIKLVGTPGTADNELIGLAGRWWQEEWGGAAWVNGQNLNDKGNSTILYPNHNPNDELYLVRKSTTDASSPTGLHYRYTGYLLLGYFITDSNGDVTLYFETGSCYHVLWKASQRARTGDDGPLKTVTFDPTISTAYDVDYASSTVSIFGEWERLPMGSVNLAAGSYNCQIVLTEESFHGTGLLDGNWAAAMAADMSFTIVA